MDVSAHDMIAEMTHLCEERRARLAGLAGDEGLSETNLVLVLETIEKVNGALDSGIGWVFERPFHFYDDHRGEREKTKMAPLPPNPLGVSPGNPFATPVASASSPTTPAPTSRTVAMNGRVLKRRRKKKPLKWAAIKPRVYKIEEENKQKQASSSSPPTQHHHQQQV